MPTPFELTYEDIQRLNPSELTKLLSRLLHVEARATGIVASAVQVSLRIDVPDGGEDGRVQWEDGPTHTQWLPRRFTLFQCKATEMGPADCKSEILTQDKAALKPRVEEVLEASGAYVLFYGRPCNPKQQKSREQAFRGALKLAGKYYSQTADILIYDAERIANWANSYLGIAAWVLEATGRSVPPGLQSWHERQKYEGFTYEADSTLEQYIAQLRSDLSSPKAVARVVGLSGLGKTRLALEALRPPEAAPNITQQSLSDSMLYVDAEDVASSGPSLGAMLIDWRRAGRMALLVIDNCPLALHERLVREIKHPDSSSSLLTLDYDVHKPQGPEPLIQLEPVGDEVITSILRQAYPSLQPADTQRIVAFAQGFPQMAVLLADARLGALPNVGSLQNDVLLKRLLWGHGHEDEHAFDVISACSLFEQVGFSDEKVHQRRFLAARLCAQTDDEFYGLLIKFLERGLLERRGRYVRVKPRPLAIRLAADWWRRSPPERARQLVDEANKEGLAEALCDQMAKLHFLPEAQSLVAELCGEQGPFGQAEVLNSEWGSRLFRSLAEVNPKAAAEALDRVFGRLPHEALLEVRAGRRNLIWTLEKLCFWERTFDFAAWMTLRFAAAENENIANNATGQLLQLFHIRLPGTQAPFSARLNAIDRALDGDSADERRVAVLALGAALETDHFSRMVGVEQQGSGPPLRDYEPKTWGEVFGYWRECLRRLTAMASGDGEVALLARGQIATRIPGLVQHGLMEELETAISSVLKKVSYWPEAQSMVKRAVKYIAPRIPEGGRKQLAAWSEQLRPQSLTDRLYAFVTKPSNDVGRTDDGQYVDYAELEAQKLGQECAQNPDDVIPALPSLLLGPQINGFAFGYELGRHLTTPEQVVDASLDFLGSTTDPGANPIVLSGLLAAIRTVKPERADHYLDLIATKDGLRRHLVQVTRVVGLHESDCKRLWELIEKGELKPEQLGPLSHARIAGNALKAVIQFCERLGEAGPTGAHIGFNILAGLTLSGHADWDALRTPLRQLLLTDGFVESAGSRIWADESSFEEIVTRLLTESSDTQLTKRITRGVVLACRQSSDLYRLEWVLRAILGTVLSRYADISWPIVSDGLLIEDWRTHSNLTHLLGLGASWKQPGENQILFTLPDDLLLGWCHANPQRAPLIIARYMPVFEDEERCTEIHPFAQMFLQRFGHREDVLAEIGNNLESFGSVGSLVPYYELRIALLRRLDAHEKPEVRDWSRRMRERFARSLQREAEFDQERELLL